MKGNTTEFKLWAPTASKVVLNLFQNGNGGSAYQTIEMEKADKGVWLKNIENCGHGTYYTYTVTTSLETQEAVDPYARSAGVNGDRGMVVDLSRTNPDGWGSVSYMTTARYTDAVIWEVHVRDFSNKISQSRYKGKFMAFTERGLKNSAGISVGVDYLLDLGVTHVHLMPSSDYATVDEANPDSGFNWGYDPKNYNVPEGSYSTNPYDGEVRVTEFKKWFNPCTKQACRWLWTSCTITPTTQTLTSTKSFRITIIATLRAAQTLRQAAVETTPQARDICSVALWLTA